MAYRTSTRADRPSNRQLRRDANQALALGARTFAVLLAVLAQSGGEVTVTDGTMAQVDPRYMAFEIVPGKTEKEKIVRLVRQEEGTHDIHV